MYALHSNSVTFAHIFYPKKTSSHRKKNWLYMIYVLVFRWRVNIMYWTSAQYIGSYRGQNTKCNTAKFHILFSQIRDSPISKARSPYLYPPRTGWLGYTPRHWVPFSSPPMTRRATAEVFEPASTWIFVYGVPTQYCLFWTSALYIGSDRRENT
jgi:hypothetical protein